MIKEDQVKKYMWLPIFFGAIFLFVSFLNDSLRAAETAQVAATVTAQNISVGVSDGIVAYGTIGVGATADTTSNDKNNSQTATNTGNVTEDFNISGSDSTNWTLAGTAGENTYTHKFCNNGTCDASPNWTALTTGYQTLATGVGTSATQELDLQIGTPTSTTFYTEQTVNVTVQAVAN